MEIISSYIWVVSLNVNGELCQSMQTCRLFNEKETKAN